MTPITHLSLNLAPDDRVNSMLLSLRVVPDGRDGNVVYGRTLRVVSCAEPAHARDVSGAR